ncbi:MAG: ATP-binding cassette domain-containing protein [Streptosporangiales bacterium]|nr:ATP-binding cassette domain-containing protein [Streptosporangiales bacterium]
MTERPPTVVVNDLHVTYRVKVPGRGRRTTREVPALRGVDLVAREGESIGVVGRNGSGKSTLLRSIAGLQTPTRGRVFADGHPSLLSVNAALIGDLPGARNIVLGGLALGLTPRQVAAKYDEIAEFAGLGDFLQHPMRTYSSGMQARLRFAIATAVPQRVLLVDEALATGDAEFRERGEERIAALRAQAGTVFLVSHTLAEIERSCDRCVWIEGGRVRLDGPASTVLGAYREVTKSGRLGRLGRPGRGRAQGGGSA